MTEQIGITEPKCGDFAEWYTQTVLKAELADYVPIKGMIAVRPYGYAIWERLRHALDERFGMVGVQNAFLPTLIPESLLVREKSHFEGFNPEVYWVTHSGDTPMGDRLALRPTSETVAYTMYAKWIKSWRDLPLKLNFWNTALRAEIKSTKPFLRTSEFLWQEGHTAHADRAEAEQQVDTMLEIYRDVTEGYLAVPVISGRKSRREQFVGADYTLTIESMMPDGRALQMGTSHMLGQNFSVPFDVKFTDSNNTERHVWQTSWGVSWRLLGAMIMTHGDDKGLVLPPRLAPIQVVIIPIYGKKGGDDIRHGAARVRDTLQKAGLRVHIDDREDMPGYKFNHWELRGVPLRLELGPRDVAAKQMVAARRDTGVKCVIPLEGIVYGVSHMLDMIQSDMLESARGTLKSMTYDTCDKESLLEGIQRGGFLRGVWCGKEPCEAHIKEDTGADIRLIEGTCEGACVWCGGMGTYMVLFARGY